MVVLRGFQRSGYITVRSLRNFCQSTTIQNKGASSCKAGTVLNLQIKKNGTEPIALEDDQYPEWLWGCLDKAKVSEELKEQDIMKWRRKQLNKVNSAKIRNNNFLANMK